MSVYFKRRGTVKTVNFVNWIQSNGTEYIISGIKQAYSADIVFEFEFAPTNVASPGIEPWFGGNGTMQCKISSQNGFSAGVKSACVVHHAASGATTITTDGILRNTFTYSGFDNLNICLFTLGNAYSTYLSRGKLYRARITFQNVLVFDARPCLDSDGVPCLYDLISKQYFYNAGSGTFAYG